MTPGPTLSLLLASTPTYPKVPPELNTEIGWMCLGVVVCLLYWAWTRAESATSCSARVARLSG